MARKMAFALIIALMLLASIGGSVSAKKDSPGFQKVFNGADFGIDPNNSWGMTAEVFKNQLYVTISDWGNFGTGSPMLHLFRSADGQNWEPIVNLGIDPNYFFCWDMYVFHGKLYMAVHNLGMILPDGSTIPGMIIRSANGTDWEIVFQDTPDRQLLHGNSPDKFGEFNGMLYFTTEGYNWNDWNIANGQVWRSPSGDPGSWHLANPNLGNMVWSTSSPVSFKGRVYVSGRDIQGVHVWQSPDGSHWQKTSESSFADPANESDGSLAVYKDYLYLSTTASYGEPAYPDGRIYRTRDGQNWELVVDQGFGNPNHVSIGTLFVYKGDLYAGTDGVDIVAYLYRTHSASWTSWEMVNPGGIGPNTYADRNMQAVFKGNLYLATTACVFKMVDP